MKSKPIISVIVPFYNIAEYVPYCLDSLIDQDFDDYEVVCVDDGSTDNTSAVLDEYGKRCDKIVILHKSNGGLSDARNYGVQKSQGRLISFVDGDDIISPYYLSSMYQALDGMESCIVMGGFKTLSFKSEVRAGSVDWEKTGQVRRLTRRDAFKAVLLDTIQPSAWAKLAPRWVYERVPFPLGVRYEEIRTILDLLLQVKSYVHLEQKIYGYVMREGSITWSKTADCAQLEEYRKAINIICSKAEESYPDLSEYVKYQRALLDTRAHSQLPIGSRKSKVIKELDDEILADLRRTLDHRFKSIKIPPSQLIRFALLARSRPIYDAAYAVFRKRIKRVG